MAVDYDAHTDLAAYPLTKERRERLFSEQIECSVTWTGEDDWPLGVIHWYVWRDGSFWVSSGSHRPRVNALRARPRSSVIVTGLGSSIGPGVTVTAKTLATVHDDPAVNQWFHPALATRGFPDDEAKRNEWLEMLDHTPRVTIQLEPVKWISLDSSRLFNAVGWREDEPSA